MPLSISFLASSVQLKAACCETAQPLWLDLMHLLTLLVLVQVCIISVITSVILFALPLAGRCHACDSANKEHCVKSE
jgi:hypothetical protein